MQFRLLPAMVAALVSHCVAVAAADERADSLDTVVVVGSHIENARIQTILPVTTLTTDQIAATGAVSGDDLMRTLPQMGDVVFNATNDQQTSNAARGDVASIDLRGAGLGNTLVLLDGRRMVEHPTSQSQGGVPLFSYNAQSLPTAGLSRVEVLPQGAAAVYGADAVAGVVNVVTRKDVQGASADVQYGFAQGTHRNETNADVVAGSNFANDRGNVTLLFTATHRTAQYPSDEPYTRSQDLQPLFAAFPAYATSSAPDGRGNQSSFPALVALNGGGGRLAAPITQNGTALTTAAGAFHVQPALLSGCVSQIGNGLCIAKGSVPYATTANSLRYDAYADDAVTIAPEVDRQNLTFNAHYNFTGTDDVYSELNYYRAGSHGLTTQPTALVPIGVPASNYFDPLGPTSSPNRLPGLGNVPASGLPVSFATYRFNDLGPDRVDVTNFQERFLVGMRGELGGFRYDTAALYGEARVTDYSDGIASDLLAKQLALSTPDAYNPFNGGCLDGAGGHDCTPSAAAALQAIRIRLRRESTTKLVNLDYKLSRPDLIALRAGDLGLAFGVEGRREIHSDDRDPRVNGSTPFIDPVLRTVSLSSAVGVNNTPSTADSRNVASLFGELAIPVVRQVRLQVAGRLEHYSDFGWVASPKVAMAWDVVPGVRLRGSWERGFKAPNLETTASYTYARAQTVTDWYRCQAALNKGQLATFNACNDSYGITYNESGNPQLQPEISHTYSFGIVLQRDGWTVSADRWHLRQAGVVGVVGFGNIAVSDYLSRSTGGAGDGRLIRAAPTADDVAFYSGSGLAPAGVPLAVNDRFLNVQPQTIVGVDLSVAWSTDTTRFGQFALNVEATHIDRNAQLPSPDLQPLYEARAAGTINAATPLDEPANELQANGNPKWKSTAWVTWSAGPLRLGSSVQYVGPTLDTAFLSTTGEPWHVASLTTLNLYAQYTLHLGRFVDHTWLKAGARNLLDRQPPLESDGFNGALFAPYGRYLYFQLGTSL